MLEDADRTTYCGVIRIPSFATELTDADEEVSALRSSGNSSRSRSQRSYGELSQVFILYSRLASLKPVDGESKEPFRGLGYLDGKSDTLSVRIELNPPNIPNDIPSSVKLTGRNKAKGRGPKKHVQDVKIVEVDLAQDQTALRSRSGDTGSVLWRARFVSFEFVYSKRKLNAKPLIILASTSRGWCSSNIIFPPRVDYSIQQLWPMLIF